ncbi:MAG: hypothetical protein NZ473_00605 [Candidatus Kapabacteria bacterium]|nr:hypothetical protein [Candidatus Kapabacteria bacterium]MCS7169835.1 hypothetical protein [Candidatus Kapabacteria bacterium]MDW7996633.1 hypothetical protein [Bacteroidota bacterium]MDW8225049.1 hypothetical protein [Bacteroidota bacterium]
METIPTPYSRSQLERLLPDYAFGNLSPEESQRVEKALQRHPDLAAEVEAIQAVFRRLESMEYMRELERRSSSLSLRVLNLWEAQKTVKSVHWWKPVAKVLFPALGLALFAVWWYSASFPPPVPPEGEREFLPAAVELDPPLPYTDGIVTLTYWYSGLPPVAQPRTSLPPLPTASEDEIGQLLNSLAEEVLWSEDATAQAP